MKSKNKFRLRLVGALIIVGALALVLALYNTQILNGASYRQKAEKQHVRPQVTMFDRGSIFFSSKDGSRISAATVSDGSLIYMNPSIISDAEQTYQVLSQYLKLNKIDFQQRAAKKTDIYEELAHRIPADIAKSIGNLGLVGIGITKETWRSYPATDMSSQTIGLIGQNSTNASTSDLRNSAVIGRYGVERSYENILNRPDINSSASMFTQIFGSDSGDQSSANSSSNSIVGGNTGNQLIVALEQKPGNVITSLEPTVGAYVKKILEDTSNEWHPDEIGGIVINPQNGEIISAVSLPSFDPNDTSGIKDVHIFSNPLVENVYEMGSIMKPLTMATGFDTGAFNPTSTYDDIGTMTLNGKKISNYDGKARGIIPMQQILSQSLNIGAATIALKVGAADFYKYMKSFGFGGKTGVDLPNEATGLINNLKSGKEIDIATASYGQGVAISPLSMTRALSILANGGYLITPHVVKRIDYDNGTRKDIEAQKTGSIFKKQTTEDVTRMLVEVVDKALKQGTIKHENYSIAAKTGTAQIPDHVNGGYYSDRYLHSFFGYFPAYDAKFLVFLYQVYPRGAKYASDTLTDPFDKIATFLIDYYNIPPDR
jgi:cell division protein FtsI/penicillin-binding protein 2